MVDGFTVVGLTLLDRFLLKRCKVYIEKVEMVECDSTIRFELGYFIRRRISKKGSLTYTLRSNKEPRAVISRRRRLDHCEKGLNSEYLVFSRKRLQQEAGRELRGFWTLEIQIERSYSLFNPLYKIFPNYSHHSEEFYIE